MSINLNSNLMPISLTEYSNSFKRQTNYPLDSTSVLYNKRSYNNSETSGTVLDNIIDYAKKSGVAYYGQILSGVNIGSDGNVTTSDGYIIKSNASITGENYIVGKILDTENIAETANSFILRTGNITLDGSNNAFSIGNVSISNNIIKNTSFTESRVLICNASQEIAASSISTIKLGYLTDVTENIQTQLDGKASSTHTHGNISNAGIITANKGCVVTTNNDGVIVTSSVTNTALSYISSLKSNVQTQLDGKASKPKEMSYAFDRPIILGGDWQCTTWDTKDLYYANSKDSTTNKITANPGYGRITATSFNATSDARLKENFRKITTKKSILELPTYIFDFINDGPKNNIGCKAQDLEEICPELVNKRDDGYLAIQESKIIYLLLEEVKKLSEKVEYLEALLKEKR